MSGPGRNQERVKELLISLISFEGLLAFEVLLELWDVTGCPPFSLRSAEARLLASRVGGACRRRLFCSPSDAVQTQKLGGKDARAVFLFLRHLVPCDAVFDRRQGEGSLHPCGVRAHPVSFSHHWAAVSVRAGSFVLVCLQLVVMKLRNRQLLQRSDVKRASIGGVRISTELATAKSVKELKDKFDAHQMDKMR